MTFDATMTRPLAETGAHRPVWSALTRWWSSPATASSDAELGYESAHPWTLGEDAPEQAGDTPY